MRGAHDTGSDTARKVGIIPAYAGSTNLGREHARVGLLQLLGRMDALQHLVDGAQLFGWCQFSHGDSPFVGWCTERIRGASQEKENPAEAGFRFVSSLHDQP